MQCIPFATIVMRLDIFTPRWIMSLVFMQHHHHMIFYLLDISCIKCKVMYSIVKSFISITSKAMIRCSYEGSIFLSKVIATRLFLTDTSKQAS